MKLNYEMCNKVKCLNQRLFNVEESIKRKDKEINSLEQTLSELKRGIDLFILKKKKKIVRTREEIQKKKDLRKIILKNEPKTIVTILNFNTFHLIFQFISLENIFTLRTINKKMNFFIRKHFIYVYKNKINGLEKLSDSKLSEVNEILKKKNNHFKANPFDWLKDLDSLNSQKFLLNSYEWEFQEIYNCIYKLLGLKSFEILKKIYSQKNHALIKRMKEIEIGSITEEITLKIQIMKEKYKFNFEFFKNRKNMLKIFQFLVNLIHIREIYNEVGVLKYKSELFYFKKKYKRIFSKFSTLCNIN